MDLQPSQKEDASHADFVRFGHVKTPDCGERQRKNHGIQYDVGNLHSDEEG